MIEPTVLERFKDELLECLEETFERHHGIYLDYGTSLFETLDGISADEASAKAAENAATIAAHVEHARFYLDVLSESMRTETVTKIDWREIWETVGAVSAEEWAEQKRRLRESYGQTVETIKNYERWEGEYGIAGSLAVLVHTAYHLGAIRQMRAVIKSAGKTN